MSKPMTYAEFISVCRSAGVKVVEVPTNGKPPSAHNRNHIGAWGPVNGVMIHHTVTKGTDRTVEICRKGYSGLPGPLCHGVIAKDGTLYVVGYGRTNHAGKGDRDVFNAVVAESYATVPPAPNQAAMDGNPHFYGFECENLGDGKDPWPPEQINAITRVAAAICAHHGWGAKSVIGHKEWQPGKVDPRGVTPVYLRELIRSRLNPVKPKPTPVKPKPVPAPAPAPKPTSYDARQDDALEELEARVAKLEES